MDTLSNNVLFIIHSILLSIMALGSLYLGKTALIVFTSFCCVLANLFIAKQINLFGLQVTPTDAYTIGAIMAFNLVREYFGKKAAQAALVISFLSTLAFCLLAQIHLLYEPSAADVNHIHFHALLSPAPRIFFASVFAYLVSQISEYLLYSKLKIMLHGRYLTSRNIITMSSSQLIDTLLFSFVGLYGIISSVSDVIIVSYSIKIGAILLSSPFIKLSKKVFMLRKKTDDSQYLSL